VVVLELIPELFAEVFVVAIVAAQPLRLRPHLVLQPMVAAPIPLVREVRVGLVPPVAGLHPRNLHHRSAVVYYPLPITGAVGSSMSLWWLVFLAFLAAVPWFCHSPHSMHCAIV
jgi:hypothetical protein